MFNTYTTLLNNDDTLQAVTYNSNHNNFVIIFDNEHVIVNHNQIGQDPYRCALTIINELGVQLTPLDYCTPTELYNYISTNHKGNTWSKDKR